MANKTHIRHNKSMQKQVGKPQTKPTALSHCKIQFSVRAMSIKNDAKLIKQTNAI